MKTGILALKYCFEYGWSIFPIRNRTKKPLISWKEFQNRKPTKDEITKWWTENPDASIAIVTGKISNLIVIDIDPRHGGTNEAFKNIKTPTVQTGGKGWHIYVHFIEGIQNATNIQPGIDIRGEGGYVIAPPSVHESGASYKWLINPNEAELTFMPNFVKDWIFKGKGNVSEENKLSDRDRKGFDTSILNGVSEGNRNAVAASLTGKLLTSFSQSEWDTLVLPIIKLWNTRNKPPLSERELDSVFSSIKNKAKNNPPSYQKALHSPKEKTAMQWKDPVQITELSAELNKVEWIIEGFIARGHATLLSALWKIGKTTFILWLLKHLQSGLDFAGQHVSPVKVLIISEESESIWTRRKEEQDYQEGIFITCRPVKSRLSSEAWEEFLNKHKDFCIKEKISLIVIDTIANFWSVKEENSASQVNDALLPLNNLLESNIAVLLVHHDRKSGGGEGTGSRGSGAFPGFVDIILEFKRFNPENLADTRRIIKGLSRFEETPPEMVIELTDDGFIHHGTVNGVKMEDKVEILYEILPEAPQGLTRKQILEKWPKSDLFKPTDTTLFRWLKSLEEKGNVLVVGKSNERGKPDLWAKCIALQQNLYSNAIEESEKTPGDLHIENKESQLSELVEFLSKSNAYSFNGVDSCRVCRSKKFWVQSKNNVLCAGCHPPLSNTEVMRWINL